MKQYLLKAAGIALCSIAMAGAFAQEKEKSITGDDIIIRKKTDKDAKLVIEITGGEVKVNGKAISEYNDDDVSIVKRKRMTTARITGTSAPTMFRTL
ncbi:MAG: hypothetical protein H7Y27_06350, partial [Gemmatimonadaceae bacterium]|nr:hypothetical protein [Chitinophagaceae bacterium]